MTDASQQPWQTWWTDWTRLARDAMSGAKPGAADSDSALGRLTEAYVAFGRNVLAMATVAALRGQESKEDKKEEGKEGQSEPGGLGEVLAGAFERWSKGEAGNEVHASMRDFLGAAPAGLSAALSSLTDARIGEKLGSTLSGWTSEVLELPAVGPLRDWQAAVQALARDVLEQQRAAAAVAKHYQHALREAYARFAAFLRDPQGKPIETLTGLYDSWVDVAESAYADVVRTPEFAADFATWINAGSRARGRENGLRERLSAHLDLPQRAEINALLDRQRTMQRELDRLQQVLAQANARSVLQPAPAISATSPATAPVIEPPPPAANDVPVVLRATAAVKTSRPAPQPRVRVSRPAKRSAATKGAARGRSTLEFDIGDILSGGE